ncbi:MAG: hypothetical protein Kow00108_06760 [Calditrichia bacterium]
MRLSFQSTGIVPIILGTILVFLIQFNSAFSGDNGKWYVYGSLQQSNSRLTTGESFKNTYFYPGLRFSKEDYNISLSLPLIIQSGEGTNPDSSLNTMESLHNVGVGDLYTSLEIILKNSYLHSYQISVNLEAKFPLATNGFGTGQFDGGFLLNFKKYYPNYFFLVSGGYLLLGDSETITFNNPFTFSIGAGKFFLDHKVGIFSYYEYYSDWIESFEAPQYMVIGLSWMTSDNMNLSSFLLRGFSESSPDFLVSFGFEFKLK